MSHTVTVTRTTTTSNTSVFLLNVGYMKKIPGMLKAAHIALGVICVGLTGYYFTTQRYGSIVQAWDYHLFSPELFFLLITTTCLITSTLLLVSCLISIASATILPKTVFEMVYHGVATALLFASSLAYIIRLNDDRGRYFYNRTGSDGYNPRLTANILGFINTIVYGVACFFAWRSYKGM